MVFRNLITGFFCLRPFFPSALLSSRTVSAFCFLCMFCCCWHSLLKLVPWSTPPTPSCLEYLVARIYFHSLFWVFAFTFQSLPFIVSSESAVWTVLCWSLTSLSCMQKMLIWGELFLQGLAHRSLALRFPKSVSYWLDSVTVRTWNRCG